MSKDIIDKIKKIRSERVEQLKETIGEYNPEALFADGHDHAIMGYSSDGRVVYSADQIIGGLMNEGMTEEEAVEYFGLILSAPMLANILQFICMRNNYENI